MKRYKVNLSEKNDIELIALIESMSGDGARQGEVIKKLLYLYVPKNLLFETSFSESEQAYTKQAQSIHETDTNLTQSPDINDREKLVSDEKLASELDEIF